MDKCYVITKRVEYLSENSHYDPEFHVLCVFNNLYSAKNHLLKLSKACSQNAEWSEYGDYFRYKLQNVAVYGSDIFPREDAEITVSLKQVNYMPD